MDIRFNPDCKNLEECIEYFTKRARQMLRFDFVLNKVVEYKEGCIAHFSKDDVNLQALYIYPEYRGKGVYAKLMPVESTMVVTSDDCGIEDYLKQKGYDYISLNIYAEQYYKDITKYYGSKKATRTGLDYMNHIDEGLATLQWMGLDKEIHNEVFAAYALHPIFQMDDDIKKNYEHMRFHNGNSISLIGRQSKQVILLAMEYRSVANEYLSTRKINSIDEIRLSPLSEVNWMLVADKIQNRKDFELFHQSTHPRSNELTYYFIDWLNRLGIDERQYRKIKEKLLIQPQIVRL